MIKLGLFARRVIKLNDSFAVCRIGKLQSENLCVFFCLRKTITGLFVFWFGLDYCDHEIACEA
jgi:hypothetical protein